VVAPLDIVVPVFLQDPFERTFWRFSRLMLVLSFKWILPDSGKKVSDGVSITLERIKDSIAFSFLFIGSFYVKF
jgi:hypothetical protein